MLCFGTRRPPVACASSCSSSRLRLIAFVLATAGVLTLGACTEAPTASDLPDVASSHSLTAGHGEITVQVKEQGKGVADVLVTVVHNQNGPFGVPGDESTVTKLVTPSSGVVTFHDLPLGGYCAHITPISDQADAIAQGELVIPIVGGVQGSTITSAGAITERQGGGGNTKSVPFTEENYQKNCVNTDPNGPNPPPILLATDGASASVTLAPQPASQLAVSFWDLEGTALEGLNIAVDAWAVMPLELPWFPDLSSIFPGLLVSLGTSSTDNTLFEGLPPGQWVALEALVNRGEGQGYLIASLPPRLTPSQGTTEVLEDPLAMEPFLCTMSKDKVAAAGTATGGALEIVGSVKDGFRARGPGEEEQFRFTGDFKIAIWYDVVGDGSDALKMRFKGSGNSTKNLNVSYSCVAGECSAGTPSGSSGASAKLFQRDLESGKIRLTWLIDEVPFMDDVTVAEYSLSDFPEPSKDDQERAYSTIPVPIFGEQCQIDQSNDPSWWIGA